MVSLKYERGDLKVELVCGLGEVNELLDKLADHRLFGRERIIVGPAPAPSAKGDDVHPFEMPVPQVKADFDSTERKINVLNFIKQNGLTTVTQLRRRFITQFPSYDALSMFIRKCVQTGEIQRVGRATYQIPRHAVLIPVAAKIAEVLKERLAPSAGGSEGNSQATS